MESEFFHRRERVFALVQEAARMMAKEPSTARGPGKFITTKKDAPSGTLLKLVEDMSAGIRGH